MTSALTVLAQSGCDGTSWPEVALFFVAAAAGVGALWVVFR